MERKTDIRRPSKKLDIDQRFKPKTVAQQTSANYGQLKFGEHEGSNKKIQLRTFFGNPQSEVFCLKFDETDKMIASGNGDGSIKIFNLQTGKLMHNLQGSTGSSQTPTTSLCWKPKNNSKFLYSVNSDGSLIIWSVTSGQFLEKIVEENQIFTIDIKHDASKFATAGKDYHVRIYDDETMKQEIDFAPQEYDQLGHTNRVFTVKFLEEQPNVLLSGGWDSTILIWDIRDKKSVGSIPGANVTGNALDYQNGQILTGSYRNTDQLELYDFKQRKKIRDITWDNNKVSDKVYCYSAQFSKYDDHKTILSGCTGDNQVKIFDQEDDYKPCASVIEMQEGIYASDYGNCSNKFSFAGGEGIVYIMGLNDMRD